MEDSQDKVSTMKSSTKKFRRSSIPNRTEKKFSLSKGRRDASAARGTYYTQTTQYPPEIIRSVSNNKNFKVKRGSLKESQSPEYGRKQP